MEGHGEGKLGEGIRLCYIDLETQRTAGAEVNVESGTLSAPNQQRK